MQKQPIFKKLCDVDLSKEKAFIETYLGKLEISEILPDGKGVKTGDKWWPYFFWEEVEVIPKQKERGKDEKVQNS